MERLLADHRTAFFDTLSRQYSQLEQEAKGILDRCISESEKGLRKELARRDEERQALVEEVATLIIRASTVDKLKNENARLQSELQSCLSKGVDEPQKPEWKSEALNERDDAGRRPDDTATDGAIAPPVPYKDYAQLVEKYDRLSKTHARYVAQLQKAKAKLRDAKEGVKKWVDWYDRHPKYNSNLPRSNGPPALFRLLSPSTTASNVSLLPSPPDRPSSRSTAQDHVVLDGSATIEHAEDNRRAGSATVVQEESHSHELDAPEPVNQHASPPSSPPLPTVEQLIAGRGNQNRSTEPTTSTTDSVPSSPKRARITSSQTTEGDIEALKEPIEAPASTQPQSDDTPIVTHARSLKRKHRPDDRPIAVHEDADARQGTPHPPVRVKEEQLSSPVPEKSPVLARKETLDLDTLGGTIETPRKRRRMEEIMRLSQHGRLRAPALLSLRHERSTSLPVEVKCEAQDDEMLENVQNAAVDRNAQKSPDPFNGRSLLEVERVLDDRAISEPARSTVPSFRKPEEYDAEKRQPGNVLRPMSTNVPVLPRTDDGTRRSKSRKNADRGGRHVPLVAEDGEAIITPTAKHAKGTKQPTRRTPARTAKKSPEAKRDAEGRLHSLLEEQSPTKRPLSAIMTPASIRQSRPPAPAPSRSTARPRDRDAKRARPDGEPLRARPLARLGLEDFKINPAHNQNLDYAFAESVRTRDGKRCLPNCTKPECCGDKFRKMVAIGGALPGPSGGLFPPSREGDGEDGEDDDDDDDDDDRLLADYLGDDRRARLRRMSDAERAELLLRARAKQAADKFGRHRQAFVRRTSPAGYWRTDMPSTQEMEQDRAEARQMERARVEERHAEAMREGGRWSFRDE